MNGFRPLLILLLAALSLAAPAHLHAISTVVVDAGHGGIDRGGQPGQRNQEKIYTLAVAQKLAAKLRAAGFKVVMTRSDDTFVGLGTRCDIANAQRDAVFKAAMDPHGLLNPGKIDFGDASVTKNLPTSGWNFRSAG